jgi:aspartate kinase
MSSTSNKTVVQKYGGSSLKNISAIKNIAKKIIKKHSEGFNMVVVVSAMGKSTDQLLNKATKIIKNISGKHNRDLDMLLSTGELVSATLLSMAINSKGVNAISLTGTQAGIKTNLSYGSARISNIEISRIKKELNSNKIVIVAGFQGISNTEDITTLGRGGSDTTAVALAAAIKASTCEIYTDVEGIYTADPKIVKEAKLIHYLSFEEMLEMASLGAKMHPRSIELGSIYNIPISVRHSSKSTKGTIINSGIKKMEIREAVTGLPTERKISKITIKDLSDVPGTAANIFMPLASQGINVDVIVQSAGTDGKTNLSFTLSESHLNQAIELLSNSDYINPENINSEEGLGKISIVGTGIQNQPGYAARMFKNLADADVNINMITTSEIRITCIIKDSDIDRATNVLHKEFFK